MSKLIKYWIKPKLLWKHESMVAYSDDAKECDAESKSDKDKGKDVDKDKDKEKEKKPQLKAVTAKPVPTHDSSGKTYDRDELDDSFNDHQAAYKSKTTWEVFRAGIVYNLCSINYLVDNNKQAMKTFRKMFGDRIFKVLMKATFYGQFVAGEDQHKIIPVMKRMRSFGVKPILDYSVEEDLSEEEAQKREVESSVSEGKKKPEDDVLSQMPQFEVNKDFADRRYKVTSARTYFYLNEATCEKNTEIFLDSLQAIASSTYGTGITAIKLTALGRPQLLLLISEVIMRARQFVSEVHKGQGNVLGHHLSVDELSKRLEKAGIKDTNKFLENVVRDSAGVIHLYPWSGIIDKNYQLNETFMVPSLKDGRMVKLVSQLSKREEEMFRNMIRRVNTLVKTAKELDVRLMIDAEQTYFQPAISRITLEMMNKYNREKAIVFNTYQCYRRDTLNEVTMDLEQATRQNFFFGCKLVRGAYMDQERARASAMGYADPINPTYEATSQMYEKTLSECLRKIKELKEQNRPINSIGIMVASHNEDTVRFALKKMKEMEIPRESKVICFGQLLGMCDYITFPLGQAGYSAYKYTPYGPVHEVLPYLSRRATENKGILKKVKKEKRLIRRELMRRLMKGQIFYEPKGNYMPA